MRITVELTKAELAALTGAVALAEATWEDDHRTQDIQTLLRAWDKILAARDSSS